MYLPDYAAEFRRILVDCDVDAAVEFMKQANPNMPVPENRDDALIVLHMARTGTEKLPFRFRAYSHKWLTERMLPSQLPDELKPKAERMYPRVVTAVGICVATMTNRKFDYHHYVTKALCDVVENFYADGVEDPVPIKARMKEVHDKLRKQR